MRPVKGEVTVEATDGYTYVFTANSAKNLGKTAEVAKSPSMSDLPCAPAYQCAGGTDARHDAEADFAFLSFTTGAIKGGKNEFKGFFDPPTWKVPKITGLPENPFVPSYLSLESLGIAEPIFEYDLPINQEQKLGMMAGAGGVDLLAAAVGAKVASSMGGRFGVPKGALWTSTKSKSAVENAFGHYKKHIGEIPEFKNAKQYVEGTQKFLNSPPKGTLTKTRSNGDTPFIRSENQYQWSQGREWCAACHVPAKGVYVLLE
ncbi:MAG: hypothetical protein R2684_04515 [Pyrinomonadaceae bacterium]